MRIYIDSNGLKHGSILKGGMSDMEQGYQVNPPDVIKGIDWENVPKELHNALVDRGVFTYQDILNNQTAISSAILSVLKKRITTLYRDKER